MLSHFLPAFLDNASQMLVLLSIYYTPGGGIIRIFMVSKDDSSTLQTIIETVKRQERKTLETAVSFAYTIKWIKIRSYDGVSLVKEGAVPLQ